GGRCPDPGRVRRGQAGRHQTTPSSSALALTRSLPSLRMTRTPPRPSPTSTSGLCVPTTPITRPSTNWPSCGRTRR
ncbi:hypothetical protein HMPREF0545_1111, partial [Ligilactobacillus salivarius DSM 20555 = ATCC 11741]